ncbi:putative Glyco_trans_2-like domain-containing protein [Vibrio owensii]|uniref:glycosyltransferase family 2 protein n=1 Tax=Vibrio owensii TaxID=696485 RepID=UPI002895DE4E|nr:putative Glyco_trans_2-like domain-containing protein [Vibrio owensii]CAH1554816.1 putative Glyco_trans_2-like domain-containing protein [Vibrio owensii]
MFSISVIIPTKNRPFFLERAYNSILNQSIQVNEIIVVDDCSDFQQYEFLNDNRVKLIRNSTSLGGAASRNIGVSNATGDIIMFLDDDDSWDIDKVKNQINFFKDDKIGIVFSGKKVVYDSDLDKVVREIIPTKNVVNFSSLCECNHVGSTSSVALRRKDFEKALGFDTKLMCFQDYDLWLRVCKSKTAIFDNSSNVFYTVFKKEGMQISRSIDGRHVKAGEYLLEKYSSEMSSKEMKLFRMNLCQLISKALNFSDSRKAFLFSIKSIIAKPSIRGFKFLLASILSIFGYTYG